MSFGVWFSVLLQECAGAGPGGKVQGKAFQQRGRTCTGATSPAGACKRNGNLCVRLFKMREPPAFWVLRPSTQRDIFLLLCGDLTAVSVTRAPARTHPRAPLSQVNSSSFSHGSGLGSADLDCMQPMRNVSINRTGTPVR